VTSALPQEFSFSPRDTDTNADNIDDLVRAQALAPLTSTIEPRQIANVHFDCAAGTPARGSDFTCGIAELVNPSGEPFSLEVAALAHCVVTLGGGLAPTTTTTSTSSTTVITSPTTTTSIPASCGNGMVDGTDECDDGNSNPNDGCTNFCTLCGNSNITAPETCDDGNNLIDDDCPEDCQIGQCAPTAGVAQTITITASRADLTSINLLLDYPDGGVALGGGPGPDLPPGTITDTPADATPFDLEHAVRVVVSGGFTFDTALIGKVNFLGCTGQPLPSASDYHCTVIDASVDFNNVTGVTCSVSIP